MMIVTKKKGIIYLKSRDELAKGGTQLFHKINNFLFLNVMVRSVAVMMVVMIMALMVVSMIMMIK